LPSASSKDLIAIMTDHYKSQTMERSKTQRPQQNPSAATQPSLAPVGFLPKEEFICTEKIVIPKKNRHSGNGGGGNVA
jgi:hypothetical protein